MRARDVMRSSFAIVKPETSILDAARLLLQNNQRCLPVCDEDQNLVGVISEGDLLHRDELDIQPTTRSWLGSLLASSVEDLSGNKGDGPSVRMVMSKNAVCVDEEASLDEIVGQMDRHRISQVLVVCGSKVIGIVSRFELIAALERKLVNLQASRSQCQRAV